MTGPRTVHVNGVDLRLQAHGDSADPVVLLISGAATTMDMWPGPCCEQLAAGGRYVVRYDLRDTGESTTYGAGGATYTFTDLVGDVVALLDELGVERAHLAGMSMGGSIAQVVALSWPDRVETITLVATSPVVAGERALPEMTTQDQAEFGAVPAPDWSDPDSVVDYLVGSERICAARTVPFDSEAIRATMRAVVDRSSDPAAMENHFSLDFTEQPGWSLARIAAPTLAVHGDEDPVFPLPHGQALAAEIPGARLLVLPQVGHEVPPRCWDDLIDALLRHTAARPATP
jgi:pimeloyl-ACP methyl ester carboxylesterase